MADERDALALRTQIEEYWIHDVEYSGVDTIIYRAEDMRLNREVWLHEYFPQEMAKRYRKDDGQSRVYVHPTQSEAFAEGKAQQQTVYESLKGIEHPSLPSVLHTFESGATFYVATQYRSSAKRLRQLYNTGKTLSEQQIGIFALSLATLLLSLRRYQLQLHTINADTTLIDSATKESIAAYTEFTPFQTEDTPRLIYECGRLLHRLANGGEEQEFLEPLQPDGVYSAALCGLINRMVSEEVSKRPKTFEELQTLLQGYHPGEAQCEPLVCERSDNPLSSVARLASLVVIFAFAYYVFTQPERLDMKNLSWFDAARYHLVAYFGNAQAQRALGEMYENGSWVDKDPQEAFDWYRKAASNGDLYSQNYLAYLLVKGMVDTDPREVYNWLLEAARSGDEYAQYSLGWLYSRGKIVAVDNDKALSWYKKAAAQGNVDSVFEIGELYRKGYHDYDQAMGWYKNAAEKGRKGALTALGYMYEFGLGVPKDHDIAFDWYVKAADNGEEVGQYNLGVFYEYGKGTEIDYEKANYWYSKAAEQGYSDAVKNLSGLEWKKKNNLDEKTWERRQRNVAYEKIYGNGEHDPEGGFAIFSELAEKGDVYAQKQLGYLYMTGRGTSLDYTKAMHWFRKAAKQGDAYSCGSIGKMYRFGQGVAQNSTEARYWFKKGVERNDAYSKKSLQAMDELKAMQEGYTQVKMRKYTKSQGADAYRLGYEYEKGINVAKDHKKALEYYLQAAQQGNGKAQFRLAELYERSDEIKRDYKAAFQWYKKASEHGKALAYYRVSKLYRSGHGVKKDEKQALIWCRKAAERGLGVARGIMGACYEFGWGTTINYNKARYWYKKAIESGYKNAVGRLESLEAKMHTR